MSMRSLINIFLSVLSSVPMEESTLKKKKNIICLLYSPPFGLIFEWITNRIERMLEVCNTIILLNCLSHIWICIACLTIVHHCEWPKFNLLFFVRKNPDVFLFFVKTQWKRKNRKWDTCENLITMDFGVAERGQCNER